jgi:hypothetical protein
MTIASIVANQDHTMLYLTDAQPACTAQSAGGQNSRLCGQSQDGFYSISSRFSAVTRRALSTQGMPLPGRDHAEPVGGDAFDRAMGEPIVRYSHLDAPETVLDQGAGSNRR